MLNSNSEESGFLLVQRSICSQLLPVMEAPKDILANHLGLTFLCVVVTVGLFRD